MVLFGWKDDLALGCPPIQSSSHGSDHAPYGKLGKMSQKGVPPNRSSVEGRSSQGGGKSWTGPHGVRYPGKETSWQRLSLRRINT